MRKTAILVLLLMQCTSSAAIAKECMLSPCNAWMNCLGSDEPERFICYRQMKYGWDKGVLSSACIDLAECVRLDDGSCGWRELAPSLPDCIKRPEKYNPKGQ
jgi:hypothetical protein